MTDEELEWQKACEAELNFEKAVDMATGCIPMKSKEDFDFMNTWIFYGLIENESRTNFHSRLHS